MAFPTGWGRRCALVIQSSKVDANLADFPILLTKDTLPSEMFDHDGSYPALEGGGDVRFSLDEAGNTQLACEVVSFSLDNADNEAEIWVKVPSVSSSTDTTIYVWYNKAGETQPAADSTYGSENVWDNNFKMVQHMNDASTLSITDSTSNDNDGTKRGENEPIETTGKIGKGQDFDGNDDCINIGDTSDVDFGLGNWSLSALVYPTLLSSNANIIIGKDDKSLGQQFFLQSRESGKIRVRYYTSTGNVSRTTDNIVLSANTWQYIVGQRNGDMLEIYLDGTKITVSTETGTHGEMNSIYSLLQIGKRTYSGAEDFFSGIIDEVRISSIARSADWIKASYNNQNSPSTFVIEGTPVTPGGVAPTSVFYGPIVGPFGGPI